MPAKKAAEKRADPQETSGATYTKAAFVEHYGKEKGQKLWDQAGSKPKKGGKAGKACLVCGSTAHLKADCKHKEKDCSICGKVGHLKAMCREEGGGKAKKEKEEGGEGAKEEKERPPRKEREPMTLLYFSVMAKGLGPALVAELSGLPWKGPKDAGFDAAKDWAELKASGVCPFGQLPLLKTSDGRHIGQSTAIVNYIAQKARTEGRGRDYITSQMLIAEGEDLYALMQKFCPTMFVKLGEKGKGDQAALDTFWKETAPAHLEKLEKLIGEHAAFTPKGTRPGELYLFAMLHQMVLCKPELLATDATPKLDGWYKATLANAKVAKVLSGESTYGPWVQYFVNP